MTCKDCIHSGLCYKENDYENFPDRCGDFIPNRPQGKWIKDEQGIDRCSKCFHRCMEFVLGKPSDKFCIECGAKMDGGEEE